MFHLFLTSALCGMGFVIGSLLTFLVCTFLPKKQAALNTDLNRESVALLKERNAQWRPSQLDYFAAAAMQGDWAAQDDESNGMFTSKTTDAQYGHVAEYYYRAARAMCIESAKHKDYLPPVPDNV